jgi:hypothetical protein
MLGRKCLWFCSLHLFDKRELRITRSIFDREPQGNRVCVCGVCIDLALRKRCSMKVVGKLSDSIFLHGIIGE